MLQASAHVLVHHLKADVASLSPQLHQSITVISATRSVAATDAASIAIEMQSSAPEAKFERVMTPSLGSANSACLSRRDFRLPKSFGSGTKQRPARPPYKGKSARPSCSFWSCRRNPCYFCSSTAPTLVRTQLSRTTPLRTNVCHLGSPAAKTGRCATNGRRLPWKRP